MKGTQTMKEKDNIIEEPQYYDGTKLLSLKDINGRTPELYLCTTNRTGGKTTYFSRLLVNRFIKQGKKFALLYRYNYELDDISDKFFKDIKSLFFFGWEMKSKRRANGIFHELFLYHSQDENTEQSCGYAISLNSSDALKKYSHLFSDVDAIFFDEFQSETNHYCADEIKKFLSVYTSIARGQGMQHRYVPVYMCSNQVSIINPYYVKLGICNRLNSKVNFLRGDGFVLENGFIESASRAMLNSGIARAFAGDDYIAYSSQNVYLNDNMAFVEIPNGEVPRYLATIRYNNSEFGIKEYRNLGIIYCDDKPDRTYKYKISVTTEDHNINYVMLKSNDLFITNMRYFFDHGAFRFKDLRCKEALMKCVSY